MPVPEVRPFRSSLLVVALLTFTSGCSRNSPEEQAAPAARTNASPEVVSYDTSRVVPPPLPRKSPMAVARTTLGDTYVKIVYGTPLKRGRVVFGALEPFGQVWRLGANEATEITSTGPLRIADVDIAPGTYSVFAIPEPNRWQLIINRGLGQWGAYDYDETLDVARIPLSTTRTEKIYEALTIWFDEPLQRQTVLHIAWDDTEVTIPVSTSN